MEQTQQMNLTKILQKLTHTQLAWSPSFCEYKNECNGKCIEACNCGRSFEFSARHKPVKIVSEITFYKLYH